MGKIMTLCVKENSPPFLAHMREGQHISTSSYSRVEKLAASIFSVISIHSSADIWRPRNATRRSDVGRNEAIGPALFPPNTIHCRRDRLLFLPRPRSQNIARTGRAGEEGEGGTEQ